MIKVLTINAIVYIVNVSIDIKEKVKCPESDWVKAENVHPPLVTQKLWDLAQESVQRRRKVTKDKDPRNIVTGGKVPPTLRN